MLSQKTRVIFDPDNELVQAFVEASEKTKTPAERRALEARRPLLELVSPGLLNVLDHVASRSKRNARVAARLRRDLNHVYREAREIGLVP